MPIIATTDSSRSRSIPELRELLVTKGIEAIVTPMYKSDDRGRIIDTKKTIVAVKEEADLVKSGLSYQLFDFSRFADPKLDQGQCWQIHITGFPNTWKRNQAVNFLKSFLEPMFTGWYLSMPTIRETNTVHGYGVITFKDKSFTEDQIRQLKLILHHKALCDPQAGVIMPNVHLRVSWQVEHRTSPPAALTPSVMMPIMPQTVATSEVGNMVVETPMAVPATNDSVATSSVMAATMTASSQSKKPSKRTSKNVLVSIPLPAMTSTTAPHGTA